MALNLPTMAEVQAQQFGKPQPKQQPRVLDRIDQKAKLAKQERDCRAAVKARDKGRCRVPACKTQSQHLHHITFRSQGGKWQASNIASLCVLHHKFVHAGLLTITGDADKTLTFEGRTK